MITRDEAEALREQLLSVLVEDAHNTQRLLDRLQSISRETGIGAHAALLLILTHLPFDEQEARGHWEAILAHRDKLASGMGREPGVRVAILDYFMNINRKLVQPTLIDIEMLESGERQATQDKLTGLATDRQFRTSLQHELRRSRRYHQHAALVLFDLDNFARINEEFGNLVGDRLLREAAILLSNKIRDIDLAARPGEDEIALLLPETDRAGALLVAERFRRELEKFFAGRESADRPVHLTISAGLACYPEDATTAETLLAFAAQALYHAKAAGKNAVQTYHPERRRYLRFELEPGRFEVEVLEGPDRGQSRLRNLSRNGILFVSPGPLEVGEEIELRLADQHQAAATRPLRLRGRVVRLEELPPAAAVEATDGGGFTADHYEVGVAFDLDWGDGTEDLLDFLERVRGEPV